VVLVDIAAKVGRTHIIASLNVRAAKIKCARSFFVAWGFSKDNASQDGTSRPPIHTSFAIASKASAAATIRRPVERPAGHDPAGPGGKL
jgi:hypothetical protein